MANSDHGGGPVDRAASSGPLSGLLVADFSRVLAGPYCTMLLVAEDPRFARNRDRTANHDELRAQLVQRLQKRPRMDRSLDEHGDEVRRWLSQPSGAPVPQASAD